MKKYKYSELIEDKAYPKNILIDFKGCFYAIMWDFLYRDNSPLLHVLSPLVRW